MTNSNSQRLYSLDALRGFDMFWILGGEEIFHTLYKVTGSSFFGVLSDQFTHPEWNGFHAYDLIFPLFLFLAGVATPYSIGRSLENGKSRRELLIRVVRRGLLLVVLGVIHNNGLDLIRPISEIRFASVLGRIGLAYMFANIIYLYSGHRAQVAWFVGLLIGYWFLLLFNSAPGFPMGDLTMEGNFASYIDRFIVPGKLYLGIHDPEGIVSTIPAIATGLLGIAAGDVLKNSSSTNDRKALLLFLAGLAFLAIALLWNFVLPINKNLWTSSFVMCAGGWSLVLLATFYFIIDVKGYRRWAFFFSIIGMNSILIYMSGRFINWSYTTKALFGWLGHLTGEPYAIVVMAFCLIAVKWAFLYFLYRKNVFLRV